MAWLKQRVWQLGIGAVLILIGAWLIYTAGTDTVNQSLLWVGLALVWVGLLLPLLSKFWGAETAEEEDDDDS